MAGYPYVNQVEDAAAKKALQNAFDLITQLQAQVAVLEASALKNSGAMNANGQRIINVPSPQASTDAASAGYVKAQIAAQLEAFKGQAGVDGTFTTADPFTVTVQDGLVTSIV